MADLAREIVLILNHSVDRIDTAATIQGLTLKQYIKDRLLAGVSQETIHQELLDELAKQLQGEVSRLWGPYASDMKAIVYQAEQNARMRGMQIALQGKDPDALWRWQTNGTNICEDCQDLHGQVHTLEYWTTVGLPTEAGTRCGENCMCTLVAEDTVLEPITMGQE